MILLYIYIYIMQLSAYLISHFLIFLFLFFSGGGGVSTYVIGKLITCYNFLPNLYADGNNIIGWGLAVYLCINFAPFCYFRSNRSFLWGQFFGCWTPRYNNLQDGKDVSKRACWYVPARIILMLKSVTHSRKRQYQWTWSLTIVAAIDFHILWDSSLVANTSRLLEIQDLMCKLEVDFDLICWWSILPVPNNTVGLVFWARWWANIFLL